jgi:hypothetical protein
MQNKEVKLRMLNGIMKFGLPKRVTTGALPVFQAIIQGSSGFDKMQSYGLFLISL